MSIFQRFSGRSAATAHAVGAAQVELSSSAEPFSVATRGTRWLARTTMVIERTHSVSKMFPALARIVRLPALKLGTAAR